MVLTACGGGGNTKTLKQVVEQNKLNVVSLVLNSKYTQTLVPANTPGSIPTFYFPHNDSSEQITVTGITENGEEVSLSNIKFSIIDNSGGTFNTIDDNGNLTLETLGVTTTKQITVQAEFSSLIGTATVMISSFPLQANGLLLYVNSTAAGASYTATVCDTTLLEARGVFSDGSTRTITRKIDWAASNVSTDAKFDVTDLSKPLFSSHTNTTYPLAVTYDAQTTNLNMIVEQGSFTNMVISPTSKILPVGSTQLLSLSATINNQQKTKLETLAKWTTADATIVDVNASTGLVSGVALGGPITITGQCGDDIQTSSVTVKVLELNSIEIRTASSVASDLITFNITAGNPETHKLTLYAHYSDGSEANISSDTSNINWSINLNNGLSGAITIDSTGIVTATLQGDATVFAIYKAKADSIGIKVNVN
jgi:hypothetical protein